MTHPTDALRLVPDEEQIFAWLNRKYVQRADERQRSMNLQYMEAETHDLSASLHRWLLAAAPASPLPGGGNILWMMHVRGPDDIYPAPDYDTAVAWCDYVNDVLAKRLPDVMMKAVPAVYPRTREEHAAGLPDAIKGWTLPAAPTGEPK